LDEAANRIREEVDADANIIVGSTMDPSMEGFMRVSVVATGIDASDESKEIPVPRRSLAEPLKPVQEVETVAADTADEEFEPMAEPEVAARSEASEEPSLFNAFDAQRAAAEEQMEDIFEAETAAEDDVPPPAYTPRPEREAFVEEADEAETFVAPKAPAPGTPSQDALARLQAAIHRTPSAAPRPAPQAPVASAETTGEKSRFGINSLINRMTGSGAEAASHPARPMRQQPPMQAAQSQPEVRDEREEEDDQIEIPAFLRRQAN